ncbi:hypothetical protein C8P68_1124 [Mucilaginibacter yixingensis]|uniref:Uncharacterized protein n=1 Tax=Mucilaginibacter yixingensis TaxID=1295612 RepID=A0A2T5J4R3_9SPHI|nr:hypothetical protein [Mucilaginibacter yixingensis]PTQ92404.1 hypothetical protein C8P68_1124 [Mucilaginibacter yixingensis]
MDFSSLFSSGDNLYKFLFVGGIVMFCFSMVYPLQKKQELEIEINTYNKQAEFLNQNIKDLYVKVKECKALSKTSMEDLKRLKSIKAKDNKQSKQIDIQMSTIKKTFSVQLDSLEKQQQQVTVKQIILKYNQQKINLLQEHSLAYDHYSLWLMIAGVITGVSGLFFWAISTYNSEKLKKEEIKKAQRN